jgi:signal transduction histidine kinase
VFENTVQKSSRVLGDHSKIMQILLNFLNNAFYALENSDGSHKEVRIRCEECDNGMLKIAVHDNGPGVPAEFHDKIMDPFFTTKPVGVGTGIGLSLSRSLALEMNGSVDFSSAPGDTTFFVLLKTERKQGT